MNNYLYVNSNISKQNENRNTGFMLSTSQEAQALSSQNNDKFTIVKLLIVYNLCVLFVALLHCCTSALYCIIVRMPEFDTKFLAGILR